MRTIELAVCVCVIGVVAAMLLVCYCTMHEAHKGRLEGRSKRIGGISIQP